MGRLKEREESVEEGGARSEHGGNVVGGGLQEAPEDHEGLLLHEHLALGQLEPVFLLLFCEQPHDLRQRQVPQDHLPHLGLTRKHHVLEGEETCVLQLVVL